MSRPSQTSLVACIPMARVLPPRTPVGPNAASIVRFAFGVGLPRYYGGSVPTTAFRGLLSVHYSLRPARSLTPFQGPFLRVLQLMSLPREPLRVLPAGATVCRAGSSPRRECTPSQGAHNNATERGIRGPVVGRKNHYGSRSRRGTEVASTFYSLLETAKLHGVDPAKYLRAAALADAHGEVLLPQHISGSPAT